ncbi:MAG: DUF971 domain-containing protein [Alphaproteobacteria bacterium]|nr:DUF971 domain-containing protein [Alphaproteobacteria bacterium]
MEKSHYDRAGRPEAVEVKLRRADQVLEVAYADGRRFAFPAELLRVESPSAEVQGHGPGQRVYVAGKRHVAITGIDPVGSYAVRLRFDDGHDTGLYSWEYFYGLGLDQEKTWADYLKAIEARGLSRG